MNLTIIDDLELMWRKRSSFKSLIAFLMLLYVFCSLTIPTIYFVLNKLNLFGKDVNFQNFVFLSIFIIGCLTILIVVLWLYWRQFPIINQPQIGIIFAPHSDPECNSLIYKLYDQFISDLSKRKMSERIFHKILPENQIIRDHEDALKLLNTSGARLIIHGHVDKGKVDAEDIEGFKTISFSIRHRSLNDDEKEPVIKNLAQAMAFRAFVARDRNSFVEKSIVIENISEVASYFIAMGLTLDGEVNESEKILDHLLTIIKEKRKSKPDQFQLKLFQDSIISLLSIDLYSKFTFIYRKHLINYVTKRECDEYANKCLMILDKLILLNKRNLDFFLSQAIIHFHFDRIKAARESILEAKKLAPTNPAPYFSGAFLSLWRSDYKSALKDYRRAECRTGFTPELITDIVLFLQGLYANHPDRIQILFSLAFMNDRFFDKSLAKKDYLAFIEKSKGIDSLYLLKNYSEKRLHAIS